MNDYTRERISAVNLALTRLLYGQKQSNPASVATNAQRNYVAPILKTLITDTVSFKGGSDLAFLEKAKGFTEADEEKIKAVLNDIETGKLNYALRSESDSDSFEMYRSEGIIAKKQTGSGDFSKEIKILKKVPEDLKTSEKFLAKVQKDGTLYLFTQVPKADLIFPDRYYGLFGRDFANFLRIQDYPAFMNTMFELDKAGIYHNNLSTTYGSVTRGKEVVAVQNYESAEIFGDPLNKVWNTPSFMMPSNLQDYESKVLMDTVDGLAYLHGAGKKPEGFNGDSFEDFMRTTAMLPNGIYNYPNPQDYFELYLTAKSQYHQKRAAYLFEKAGLRLNGTKSAFLVPSNAKNSYMELAMYETSEATFLAEPTKEVMDFEYEKIKLQNHHIKAYEKQGAETSYRFTNSMTERVDGMISALKIMEKVHEQRQTKGEDYDEYLFFQNKFAQFWLVKTLTWAIEYMEMGSNLKPKPHYNTNINLLDLQKTMADTRKKMHEQLLKAKEMIGTEEGVAPSQVIEVLQEVKKAVTAEVEAMDAKNKELKAEKKVAAGSDDSANEE